jgi:hypothetical protein
VENVDSPNEHEKPVGNDHGYMWRLYTYWRIEEKDGGVYVQNESVSLSRTVPALLAFIVNPLVKSIPRNVLIHLLTDTRNAVVKAETKPPAPATEPPKNDGMGVGSAEISGSVDSLYGGSRGQSPAWIGKSDILLTGSSGLEAWRPGRL